MKPLKFRYIFHLPSQPPFTYDVDVDEDEMALIPTDGATPPAWTELSNCQCEHCPLHAEGAMYCPVAVNIAGVVEEFKDRVSYDRIRVQVITPERIYEKDVPMQYGVFSILGLIMATSDCPHMRFLKPLARFHLPFASAKETIARTVSMFLLRQYLKSRSSDDTQFDLSLLDQYYANVNLVNRGIVARIRSLGRGDAGPNAIIILHSLATLLSYNIADNLPEIEGLFR